MYLLREVSSHEDGQRIPYVIVSLSIMSSLQLKESLLLLSVQADQAFLRHFRSSRKTVHHAPSYVYLPPWLHWPIMILNLILLFQLTVATGQKNIFLLQQNNFQIWS